MRDNVIERFPINHPTTKEKVFDGLMMTTHRPGGRRIVVRSLKGEKLFDTEDCFDVANATDKLDRWLTDIVSAILRPTPVAVLPAEEPDTAELAVPPALVSA